MLDLAHAGHWLSSLAYAAPVVLFLGVLALISLRDRHRKRRRGVET